MSRLESLLSSKTMNGQFRKVALNEKGFISLLLTQALGAFNDNAFKMLIGFLALTTMAPERARPLVAAAASLLAQDVTSDPLTPVRGGLVPRRVEPDLLLGSPS